MTNAKDKPAAAAIKDLLSQGPAQDLFRIPGPPGAVATNTLVELKEHRSEFVRFCAVYCTNLARSPYSTGYYSGGFCPNSIRLQVIGKGSATLNGSRLGLWPRSAQRIETCLS